jgi:hypothetical protein
MIVATLKSQTIMWAEYIWRAESQIVSAVMKWKPEKSTNKKTYTTIGELS